LILLSREQVVYGTNLYNNEIKSKLSFQILEDDLILLNRNLPNDMNETRISSNFDKFKKAKEPCPQKNDWKDWEQLLVKECFANDPSQEACLWLNSKDWGTLLSTIIVFSNDKKKYPFIHTVKERRIN
jgi:hypothetical protein